jgi:glutamate dehydrogenase/leucine dehydrogenase
MKVVVQGFGNVGAVLSRELVARGAVLIGVSDVTGGIVSADGIEIDALVAWVDEHGFVRGFPYGEPVSRTAVLETECDILIPSALERQITADNAPQVSCRLVVEAANGPTTPEADAILAQRGILIVPDVLANAGGVTVSYFEWVQDQQKYFWESETVADQLRKLLEAAVDRVLSAAERLDVDWRTAAQAVAIERLAEAAALRAIYP